MPLIEWDERRYSTGIDRYDNQHKRLFEVLNQLHDAMEEGHAEEELGDVLRELERYTEYHFTDEEEFMEGCGFADDCSECFFGHQEMHEEFAQKVTELRKKHEEGEYITMEVLEFARDWLDSHIAGGEQDQSYGEYFASEVDDYDFSSHHIDESTFQ
ncbi:bacteriohemerythrin [Halomicroarcula sp. SHR3]|uniref:bacteriohemerythrin n=1 Tax=Haloarcula rara TaxID=3033387 RepID=UPI0023E824E4|nr:bacteriohemerythrin [Halomicroarcula sp. SHR3]